MNMTFKGIKIGKLIITTSDCLDGCIYVVDPQEVWDLFMKGVKEGKIVIDKSGKKE